MSTTKVSINGTIYKNQKSAAESLDIPPAEVRKRLDSDEWPEYSRLSPVKPKDPDEKRFIVQTSKRKYELFARALEVLQVDMNSYFESAMRQAILNSLTVVEELGVEADMMNAAGAREELLACWKPKRGTFGLQADMEL